MDRFGKSDPFCVIRLGSKAFKTKVIFKNLNPVWDETFNFDVFDYENDKFVIEVYDHDEIGKNDLIGKFELPVRKIGDFREHWHHLPDSRGSVLLKASYTSLSGKSSQQDATAVPNNAVRASATDLLLDGDTKSDEMSRSITASSVASSARPEVTSQLSTASMAMGSYLIFIKILGAENLPSGSLGLRRGTYVSLQLENQFEKTKTFKRSSHPTWDEDFKFSADDLREATLQISLMQHSTLSNDTRIAYTILPLHEIPFNIFMRQSLELTYTDSKKTEKLKGEKPSLKIKLKVSPFSKTVSNSSM